MKNVIYSPEIFCWQKYGGVSRYFAELIPAVMASGWSVDVNAGFYLNAYLDNLRGAGIVRGHEICCKNRVGKLGRTTLLILNSIIFNAGLPNKEGVIHQTYYSPFTKRNRRLVLTVYDFIQERLISERHGALPKLARRKSILSAERLIAISEATKRDLLDLYNIPSERVEVIHLGVNFDENLIVGKSRYGAMQPYLLYVGVRAGYKKFETLVRAFAASTLLRTNFKLVCFGGGQFTVNETSLFFKHKISKSIEWVEGDDKLLETYYRKATVLVYPSLYEGFGLPVLEAMANGCPVICSNTSSLPEVGGNAVIYFSQHDVDSLRDVIERTVVDDGMLLMLEKRGRERARGFSWQETARKTILIYQQVIEGG
ncbi:mannosyltransferase [Gammaproteobacteria bacterium]